MGYYEFLNNTTFGNWLNYTDFTRMDYLATALIPVYVFVLILIIGQWQLTQERGG